MGSQQAAKMTTTMTTRRVTRLFALDVSDCLPVFLAPATLFVSSRRTIAPYSRQTATNGTTKPNAKNVP